MGDGSTLQYYVFEAMMINRPTASAQGGLPHWSFGVPSPFSFDLQKFLFTNPRLCAVLSVKSLAFEVLAPGVLLVPSVGWMFACAGVGFHYGIALFQNIDFVTWWGPFYLCFVWEDPKVSLDLAGVVTQSFAEAPMSAALI